MTVLESSTLTNLTAVTGLTGAELGYLVQSGASKRSTLAAMAGCWVFNVRNYGAVGDGVTNDQTAISAALAAAIAVKGTLYFPATTSTNGFGYRGSINITDVTGLTIMGDGYKGSILTHANTALDTLSISATSSGAAMGINIIGLHINGTSGAYALFLRNVIGLGIRDVECFGPTAMEGSVGYVLQSFFYGAPGFRLGKDDVAFTTGMGPIDFFGCSFLNMSGTATEPALKIIGNVLAAFHGCGFAASLNNQTVTLNGPTGHTEGYSSVNFYNCHGESTYNAANNGADFIIGQTTVFGHVGFYGGNFFGHGNSTNYRQDWLRVYKCKSLVVDGVAVSKQAATNGYSRAMIRLEASYPSAGDQYAFRNLVALESIPVYSDANGVLVTYTGNDWNGVAASFQRLAPVTKTADFTVAVTENDIISNRAGTNTATLPAAASFIGREIYLRTITAQTVVSASSNVVPLIGGSAGTAILAATAGKWARLKSDGTNWQIMAGN
jgi:hypothetical protein